MNVATCIICLVPYSEELEIVSLNCHHCFHRNCIKEWWKIRKDCPQCRRKVNPKQIYRVIISFETSETVKFSETTDHEDKMLQEKQEARLKDLEQQINSKDIILEEKEAEIQRVRHRLKKFQESNKNEPKIQDLLNQLKIKDAIINQSLNDVKEIEKMLLDLETASRLDATQKEEELADLTLRLKLKDQLLKDVLQPKDMEDKSVIEIQTLKNKLAETTKEVQNLHTKFTQISSIVDEFKLEQIFNSFTTNFSSEAKDGQSNGALTVGDLL